MLDEFLASVLSKNERIRDVVMSELTRFKDRGYLTEDPQELATEMLSRLEERAQETRDVVTPLLKGIATALREALDVPSRAEIVALTEALERQAARGEDAASESA